MSRKYLLPCGSIYRAMFWAILTVFNFLISLSLCNRRTPCNNKNIFISPCRSICPLQPITDTKCCKMIRRCRTSAFLLCCFRGKYHTFYNFSETTQDRELKFGVYMPHKEMHTILCFRLHLLPLLPSYLRIKAILGMKSWKIELARVLQFRQLFN